MNNEIEVETVSVHHENIIRLQDMSVPVVDVEEEIFFLYTELSAKGAQDGSSAFTGLGSVDSKGDSLTLTFELPTLPQNIQVEKAKTRSSRRRKATVKHRDVPSPPVLEIRLLQNKTTLRSKKGDTGSVLWRVSKGLSQILLQHLCSPTQGTFFDNDELKKCHVLELGAGTGLMSLVLSPWTRHYTVTDLDYLIPLLQKNLDANSDSIQALSPYLSAQSSKRSVTASKNDLITVEALDWLQLYNASHTSRARLFPPNIAQSGPVDVILAVDCIYNPSLLPAFVTVLNHYAAPGQTRVIVAVELRSEDVLRDFLQLWISTPGCEWDVHRVCGEGWLDASFAVWVGVRRYAAVISTTDE